MTPKETAIEIIKDCGEYIQELDYAVKNKNVKIQAIVEIMDVINKIPDIDIDSREKAMQYWKDVLFEIVNYDL